jgi:hypothetical protein
MRTVKILCFVLLIGAGAFIFIYGGYDDSPGAQLLGVIAVATGGFFLYKQRKSK